MKSLANKDFGILISFAPNKYAYFLYSSAPCQIFYAYFLGVLFSQPKETNSEIVHSPLFFNRLLRLHQTGTSIEVVPPSEIIAVYA